ncbi:MAG: hypothetical protein K2L97_03145 [Muribaculaceae bacterium]|nr:hypothetical protein [Muribaculaceae bacterium]
MTTDFITFVENELRATDNKLTTSALTSFLCSVRKHRVDILSPESIRLWVIDMLLAGYNRATRKKYSGKVHRLYKEWKKEAGADPFEATADALNFDTDFNTEHVKKNLSRVRHLITKAIEAAESQDICIFLYLLYLPSVTIGELVELKFDDATPDIPQVHDIIETMRDSRRTKYMFGLGQGKQRLPQIERQLLAKLRATLHRHGFELDPVFSRLTVTAIWIEAALKTDIPVEEIRALVKEIPPTRPYLALIKGTPLTDNRKTEILAAVADTINDIKSQWYVMNMRANKPDDIKRAIRLNAPRLYDRITFYYPTHKVLAEAKKRKTVRKEIPYLPGLLFFRMRNDKVSLLFSRIGQYAWCYRQTTHPDSPYSVIPRAEMKKFQQYIGQFTDDISMELIPRPTPFDIDDKVYVNGVTPLAGNLCVITSVRNNDGTRTYNLRLSATTDCRWTIADIPEIYLDPATV